MRTHTLSETKYTQLITASQRDYVLALGKRAKKSVSVSIFRYFSVAKLFASNITHVTAEDGTASALAFSACHHTSKFLLYQHLWRVVLQYLY